MSASRGHSKVVQVGIENWKNSTQARWITCHACAQVTAGRVAGVVPGQRMTQYEYGQMLGVTRQQVSRLSNAWKMYAELRQAWLTTPAFREYGYPHPSEIRQAPHVTTEMFTELWECKRRYALTYEQVFDFLCWAWDGMVSAEALRLFIDDAYNGKSHIPEWFLRASGVVSDLGKLRSDYGVPEEVALLASLTYDALKEWLALGYEV